MADDPRLPSVHIAADTLQRIAAASHGIAEALYKARESAIAAAEAMVTFREVMVVTQAKIAFSNEMGYRPTIEDLIGWSRETGRYQLADFLESAVIKKNPHIIGLFIRELPARPHQEEDHDRPDH